MFKEQPTQTETTTTNLNVDGASVVATYTAINPPPLLISTEAEIAEYRTELETLIKNPNPSASQIDREAFLSIRLIDHQIKLVNNWANAVNPDTILMGESHSVGNHHLMLSRLATNHGENVGLEIRSNMYSKSFQIWAYVTKKWA